MPDTIIETRRITLSRLRSGDAREMFAYRSDPDVRRYQSWEPVSVDEVSTFIGGLASVVFDTPGTWFQFGVRLRGSGELVGDFGVHFPVDEPFQAEVGVTVAPSHQGRGLATEALSGMLSHLFGPAGKHRVFASVDPRNHASMALMRKVGMREEAHFRESLWFKGEWADDLVFAVLASEWEGGPA